MKNVNMKGVATLASAMSIITHNGGMFGAFDSAVLKNKKKKICLNYSCDNEHYHSNSFCSPECCREYKEVKKQKGNK